MEDLILALVAALFIATVIVVVLITSACANKNKLESDVRGSFDNPPDSKRANEFESITEYYRYAEIDSINADAITWDDLDMDEVFDRINTCESSVGEEYLYALLHRQLTSDEEADFKHLLDLLGSDENLRFETCKALHNLGICNYNSVAKSCLRGAEGMEYIGKSQMYMALIFLPVAAGLLGFLITSGIGAVIGALAGIIANIAIYCKINLRVERHLGMMKYLCRIMFCVQKLGKASDDNYYAEFGKLYQPFSSASRLLAKIGKESSGDLADIAETYLKMFTFRDMYTYAYLRELFTGKQDEINRVYKHIGFLDSACAVLNFRGSSEIWCVPEFTGEKGMTFKSLVHPLIEKPVANDFDITGNILVTGSNASGKSSFVKAAAINAILAQSILTCTAEQFRLRRCKVVTSMAVRDDICAGDSYFVAEIKSMKRIVEQIRTEYCFCVIDEILKGTNTIERIAASVSVLKEMAETESICVAATHDIELTVMLEDCYRNVHFEETVTDDDVTFDYKIKEGAARTRNAIKLLKVNGFPKSVISAAERLAEQLSVERS
ncbi:MAG: hypothetical protein J6K17_08140 [Oscillospiraceae bacterium]|nr:hypothetical protein [Oscillospiraceae bacterium]